MLKSEAEKVVRRAIEDNGAEFTEEQILAICQLCVKISSTIVEEALASWRPSGGGKPQFFA